MTRRSRGRPLIALIALLSSWVAARAMTWDARVLIPAREATAEAARPFDRAAPRAASFDAPGARSAVDFTSVPPWRGGAMPAVRESGVARADDDGAGQAPSLRTRLARLDGRREAVAAGFRWFDIGDRRVSPTSSSRAGLARAPGGNEAPASPIARQAPVSTRRWSGDSWLLVRRGGGSTVTSAPAAFGPTYGANQAGAILRYALAPANGHRPTGYARVTGALDGADESEAALGLSARPLARVPVVAAAELRVTRSNGRARLRPAALAITQLPPLALPYGARGEAYLQGGYVGGAGATAFVDGQLRVDRALLRLGRGELRAGVGGWGGAQRGAARLDVGPTASVGFALRRTIAARLALDWRLRVAGNAAPGSGPALTLAAGF